MSIKGAVIPGYKGVCMSIMGVAIGVHTLYLGLS